MSELSSDRAAPDRIGPYKILGLLGEGGMGAVYAAEQTDPVQRRVALKVVKRGMDSKMVLARFEAERQALAMMSHPNIAKVLDAGEADTGQPYFVMEFVRGTPIHEYCDKNRLTLESRLRLLQQVCRGVQHAHHKGVIHRDLKPTNILVEMQDGKPHVKIIDFGLARAIDFKLTEKTIFTEQGQIVGTPEYMSPEQAEMSGTDIDTRADVYSLGVLMYELLTGSLPFSAQELRQAGYLEIQRRIREDTPPKPSTRLTTLGDAADAAAQQRGIDTTSLSRAIRGDLDWITMKALEKDRERRFQTAEELARDLELYLANEPVSAGPPSFGYQLSKFVRKHRTPVAAACVVLVTLVGWLVSSTVLWVQAGEARDAAQASEKRAKGHLLNWRRLADLRALEELQEDANRLWPARRKAIPAMEAWIRRAEDIAKKLPEHRASLRGFREAAGVGDGERSEFADGQKQFLVDSLTELVSGLKGFVGPEGTVKRVEARLEWARTVRVRTVEGPEVAEKWADAARSIRRDPKYGGLALRPQVGLIPIGKDAASGLWEFAHPRSGKPPKRRKNGRLAVRDQCSLVFVLLPPGAFVLGAQAGDPEAVGHDPLAYRNEADPRRLSLSAFFVSKFEMTRFQWWRLTGGDPNPHDGRHLDPATFVSWKDCNRVLSNHGLCVPTEAQWEYACRASTSTPWWTGPRVESLRPATVNIADATALRKGAPFPEFEEWFEDGFVALAPVHALTPNPFGLHHVLGNVYEWCREPFALYDADATFGRGDGAREVAGGRGMRVVRGGAFDKLAREARVSRRIALGETRFGDNVGIRPARAIEE